ncbi:FecCD family ABC transporter permease [Paenibacillus sp. y28]|uniref:FecCD family ABC transporter permease n=1 Tax=Paenibacillus sp. y28 TaxID=3129110 RepID=UPI0030164BF6
MNQLHTGKPERTRSALSLFIGLTGLLLIAALTGTFAGVKGLSWSKLPELMTVDETNLLAYKVWFVRLPRVVLALIIGAGLGVAGCLLQGITRNPLSDPEIMGINQGASFFVVLSLVLLGLKDVTLTILIAGFAGAAAGGSIVYLLSLYGKYTPTRLVLAGIAVSFFMGSLTTGFLILHDDNLSEILYWMAGKLSGATWTDVQLSLICIIPAAAISCIISGQLNIFSLGEEAAGGLGQRSGQVRRLAFILILALVGGAVALAGPIGFVGLMVPHIVRTVAGADYRRIVPLSAMAGAVLLLVADIGGQWVLYPTDTPVGIITALLGTPFFLYLMRRSMGGRTA